MIEQIFIFIRNGTFTVDYLGIRDIHAYSHIQREEHWTRLADFERLLINHDFKLVTDDTDLLHIWSRKSTQLALGDEVSE